MCDIVELFLWEPIAPPTEYKASEHLRRTRHWQVVNETPDGNCMFSALARQTDTFGEGADQAQRMRRVLLAHEKLEYIRDPAAWSESRGQGEVVTMKEKYEHVRWPDYFESMSTTTSCFGGHIEMVTHLKLFRKTIFVYELKRTTRDGAQYYEIQTPKPLEFSGPETPAIYLGFSNGNHYDTLIPPAGMP